MALETLHSRWSARAVFPAPFERINTSARHALLHNTHTHIFTHKRTLLDAVRVLYTYIDLTEDILGLGPSSAWKRSHVFYVPECVDHTDRPLQQQIIQVIIQITLTQRSMWKHIVMKAIPMAFFILVNIFEGSKYLHVVVIIIIITITSIVVVVVSHQLPGDSSALLVDPHLALWALMELLPTLLWYAAQGYFSEFSRT